MMVLFFLLLGGNWKVWATTGEPDSENKDESKSDDKEKSDETEDSYSAPKAVQVVFCGFEAESKPIPLVAESEAQFQSGQVDEFKVSVLIAVHRCSKNDIDICICDICCRSLLKGLNKL